MALDSAGNFPNIAVRTCAWCEGSCTNVCAHLSLRTLASTSHGASFQKRRTSLFVNVRTCPCSPLRAAAPAITLLARPLSANQLRLEEILQATRNFSIVGLVATQRRAPVGLEIGSLDAQLWRQGGHAHRSATNHQGYSLLCVNPSLLSTYTRHGRHHRRCRVGQSLHVSKEVSLTCLSVACIFRRDHKPHRREGDIKGLWKHFWNGWTSD